MASPKEKRQARTRQEILDGALALINEKGPDKFSVRALAKRVDYSPAGLYEYFSGKDEIIDAVCEEGDRRLRHYLRRVPLEFPPNTYLVELGRAYIQFALDNEEHFLLMFTRVRDGEPVTKDDMVADETYGILLNAVQAALESGFIRQNEALNRDDIAYGLWSLAHGMAVMQLTNLQNFEYDFERADRVVLEAFLRGLSAGS